MRGSRGVQSGVEPTGVNSVPLGLSDAEGVLDLLLRFCRTPCQLEDRPACGSGDLSAYFSGRAHVLRAYELREGVHECLS